VAARYGLESRSTKAAFERLHQRCDVFLVHKKYGDDGADKSVLKAWREQALMPAERILTIHDPRRVVDVILGVLGVLTGKFDEFERELKERQSAAQAKEVLRSVHALAASIHVSLDGKSRTAGAGGAKSKGLKVD
jgi:hypothetical protein